MHANLPSRSPSLRLLFLGLAVVSLFILAGCSSTDGTQNASTSSSAAPTSAAPGTTDDSDEFEPSNIFDVGQCYETADDGLGDQVDCADPHGFEITGIIEMPFEVVPEDFTEQLLVVCAGVLDDYMGGGVLTAGLVPTNLSPVTEVGESVIGTEDESTACFAQAPTGLTLEGSIADGGAADALGDYEALVLLEPGDCFILYDEFPAVGEPSDCKEGALMYLGSFEVDDGEYPGDDVLKQIRNERCVEIAEEADVANLDDVLGGVPSDSDWLIGIRTITCDVEVLARG